MSECFICDSSSFAKVTSNYIMCTHCGHEVLEDGVEQGYILNDVLEKAKVKKKGLLDRYQSNILKKYMTKNRKLLVDIGSASGKFLYHNQAIYRRAIGVEITPEAIGFSREVLHLEIYDSIDAIDENIDMVTAWHSLEHIPPRELELILRNLNEKLANEGRFLVSVPNNKSLQYRIFRASYAYFDVPNHLHQFSPESLDMLFEKFKFRKIQDEKSWVYNIFGYAQSMINMLTRSHNYFYYRVKRGSADRDIILDVSTLLLLPVVLPIAVLLAYLVDFNNKKLQGIITACYEKRTS